jgi:DNA-binding winged helix-turn-helix (wHTH) protein
MAAETHSPVRLAFGPFEVDADREELLKNGARLRLTGQPFQILLLLLARPDDVVTREQLREQIWPQGTFVDFEHGLNAAINKLRKCLGDSAEKPRYIATVPGRGYRFIGDIERRSATEELASDSRGAPFQLVWVIACAVSIIFGIWGVVTVARNRTVAAARPVLEFTIAQPTGAIFVPPISRQSFAISPDGTRLAFTATDSEHGTGVWIRDLAALDSWYVPGTEGAWAVFWSRNSHSFFYSVKRTLKQANLDTHSTRSVATLPIMPMFGAWRSNTKLSLYLAPGLFYELGLDSGTLRELSHADMRWMQFLPNGDKFLHVVWDPGVNHYRALASEYAGGQTVPLLETDSRVLYAPSADGKRRGALFICARGSYLCPGILRKTASLDGLAAAVGF